MPEDNGRDDRQRDGQRIFRVQKPKHREGETYREHAARIEHRLAANPVGKPAKERDCSESYDGRKQNGVEDHAPRQQEFAGDVTDGKDASDTDIADLGELEADGGEKGPAVLG